MKFRVKSVSRIAVLGASCCMVVLSLGYASQWQTARPALAPEGVVKTFGIDNGGTVGSSNERAAQAAATGVYWVRSEVSWADLEPTPGVYNFWAAEDSINRFLDAGLNPVIYFAYNPAWTGVPECGPVDTSDPAMLEAFANALEALVAHFSEVEMWAVSNEVDQSWEPDNVGAGCFGSYSKGGVNNNDVRDSKEYAIMLATAWKAVHAGNPNAKLATGAIAYDNFDETSAPDGYPGGGAGGKFNYNFLDELFNYMSKNELEDGKYFDYLMFNYYDIYGPHWQNHNPGLGIQAKAADLRAKMKQYGLPIAPLLVGETGEESFNLGLKGQARCLHMTLVRGAASKIKGIMWWTFRDFPDPSEWKYGIVDQNYDTKPAYDALKTLTTHLNGYKFKGNFTNAMGLSGVEAYRFKKGDSYILVAWSATYTPPPEDWTQRCSWARHAKTVTLAANVLRVVDFLGKPKDIADNSFKDKDPALGKIAIKVKSKPKIIIIDP